MFRRRGIYYLFFHLRDARMNNILMDNKIDFLESFADE